MAGRWIITMGAPDQIQRAVKGEYIQGRREPRIAIVGRSNVGKSTLINALLGERLAQTSAQPGKTRLLHLYLWEEANLMLVDLPGYGYAKASQTDRDAWAKLIDTYLKADRRLELALVLLDSRNGPTDKDIEAIQFLSSSGVDINVVFTKVDGIKTQSERAKRKKEANQALKELGLDPDSAIWLSAKQKDIGLKKLCDRMMEKK